MKKFVLIAALLTSTPAFASNPVEQLIAAFHPYDQGARDHRTWTRMPKFQPQFRAWRASFYGGGPKRFEPNTHTASGERFNQWGLTAAHRTLPIGTKLHVCYRGCTVVRVNDRGPALWTGRNLDLSRGAAAQIGLIQVGSANVHVEVLR